MAAARPRSSSGRRNRRFPQARTSRRSLPQSVVDDRAAGGHRDGLRNYALGGGTPCTQDHRRHRPKRSAVWWYVDVNGPTSPSNRPGAQPADRVRREPGELFVVPSLGRSCRDQAEMGAPVKIA